MELKDILLHYGPLSGRCVEHICRESELRYFSPSQAIVEEGRRCGHIFFNKNGLTRVHRETEKGDSTLLFGSEGDVYTSPSSWFAGEASPYSLSAILDTETYALPYESLRRLQETHPEVNAWMLGLSMGQLYVLERKAAVNTDLKAEERVRVFFFEIHNWTTWPYSDIWSKVPLKYIASYLGMTPETLSRIRRRLLVSRR